MFVIYTGLIFVIKLLIRLVIYFKVRLLCVGSVQGFEVRKHFFKYSVILGNLPNLRKGVGGWYIHMFN